MKKVCVFGNFSGRNAGDNALLECLMEDVSAVCPEVEYWVPTISPSFVVRTYSRFSVRPVSLLPWWGSAKILGIPTMRAALRTDLILVTDAILFDRHFWNPLHNYLNTLSRVLPRAAACGIPVVLYNCHLGPVSCGAGRRALTRLLEAASVIVLRDEASRSLMHSLGVPVDGVVIGADCALNIAPCDPRRGEQIAEEIGVLQRGRPVIGLTLCGYLAAYPGREAIEAEVFVRGMARLIDGLIDELDAEVLMISTQPMDLGMNRAVQRASGHRDRIYLMSNRRYTHRELAAMLSRVDVHVGMRTHSLIFASSLYVPVIGIDAYPKNAAFLDSIKQDHRMIECRGDLQSRRALDKVLSVWRDREAIRSELRAVMPEQKQRARVAASLLTPYLLESEAQRGQAINGKAI
jgi:polysaccharide pyruvyl transferase WcaK-like protein